jgi:hypothetical protein
MQKDSRPLYQDLFLILCMLVLVGCIGIAFVAPWLNGSPTGGFELARYFPVADGDSWLGNQVNREGVTSFKSQNTRLLSPGRAMTSELRQASIQAVRKFVQSQEKAALSDDQVLDRLSRMVIIINDYRDLGTDAKVVESQLLVLRTDTGDYEISIYYPDQNKDVVFDPPLLLRQADFQKISIIAQALKLPRRPFPKVCSVPSPTAGKLFSALK